LEAKCQQFLIAKVGDKTEERILECPSFLEPVAMIGTGSIEGPGKSVPIEG
jgi:hypothetical protein